MGVLEGKAVLVTRAREDAPALSALIVGAGGSPVLLPCIELAEPRDRRPLEAMVARLRAGWLPDLIVLASPHAVRRFAAEAGGLPPVRIAAVGEETAKVLRDLGASEVVSPAEGAGAEALLAALGDLSRLRVMLPRAEEATAQLLDGLRARGAEVEAVPLYRTAPAPIADAFGAAALRGGRVDAISFASGSAARGFAQLFGADAVSLASRCAVACIGSSCAQAAQAAGLPVDAVGTGGLTELIEAVARALGER
jgi:uroporphyrinogen III methyltransferase/synthase